MRRAAVGSYGAGVSYERGTPVPGNEIVLHVMLILSLGERGHTVLSLVEGYFARK